MDKFTTFDRELQAMKKLKEAVLRLSEFRSSLSPSQIEDRFHLLFRSSYSLCPPIHPPYAEMIIAAIRELNEGGGSKEESLSSFIKSRHQDLPIAHARLLSHHLKKLVERGEIVFTSKSRYRLPNLNPNLKSEQQQKKRPRSRKGRSKTKHDRERNGELQLVARDEIIVPVGNGDVGGDLIVSHSTDTADIEHFQNPNPQSKKRRIEEKPEHEHQEEQELAVEDETVSSIVRNDMDGSLQLQLASVPGMVEPLKNNPNEPVQHGEQELEAKDQSITPIGDGNGLTVSPQPPIEMAPLQNQKKKEKGKDGRGRPKKKPEPEQHGEQGLVAEEQSITPIDNDNGLMVSPQIQSIEMPPLQNPYQQKKKEKKGKDGRGRPKKKPETEQHGGQGLVAKEQSITPIDNDNGSMVSPQIQSIEKPPLLNLNQQKKRRDGRRRPKKKKPELVQQLVLQDDIKAEPLQKKRGRPKKKKDSEEQQPVKIKRKRGRPKKNIDSEDHQQLVMVPPDVLEMQPLRSSSHGK